MASIYVMIPAYRDAETSHTIRDLFEKSSGKHTINVGVFWQLAPEDDFIAPDLSKYSIRHLHCLHTESHGCCWARSKLSTELYDGEDYILSIDAHTRFVLHWDRMLIDVFNRFSGKRLMSTYPSGYEPPNIIHNSIPHKIHAHGKNFEGLPLLSPVRCSNVPKINYFLAAGFMFGEGDMFKDVLYDPNLYFFGEEISLAVRFFTSNYTIWNPAIPLLYHYYVRASSPHHWEDNKTSEQIRFRDNSVKRVKHLLELEISNDTDVLFDLHKYDLGNKRTLQEYFDLTNIKNLPVTT